MSPMMRETHPSWTWSGTLCPSYSAPSQISSLSLEWFYAGRTPELVLWSWDWTLLTFSRNSSPFLRLYDLHITISTPFPRTPWLVVSAFLSCSRMIFGSSRRNFWLRLSLSQQLVWSSGDRWGQNLHGQWHYPSWSVKKWVEERSPGGR